MLSVNNFPCRNFLSFSICCRRHTRFRKLQKYFISTSFFSSYDKDNIPFVLWQAFWTNIVIMSGCFSFRLEYLCYELYHLTLLPFCHVFSSPCLAVFLLLTSLDDHYKGWVSFSMFSRASFYFWRPHHWAHL